jgi:Fe-S cluster biogenesis protein NfuA
MLFFSIINQRITITRLRVAKIAHCVYGTVRSWNPRRTIKMKELVQAVIDKIRPMLQADGGDVELVGVEGGVVKVRLQGACRGCPMSQMTLKNGIEEFIKKEVPEVDRVESVD